MKQVNLTKRVPVNGGLRYCPVVYAANGKIKPDVVIVDGEQQTIREGSYSLDWYEGTKRVRLAVGKDATEANNARERKQAELHALDKGIDVHDAPVLVNGENKRNLAAAIASYLQGIKLSRKHKTYVAYVVAFKYFGESCHKLYLEDIVQRDMQKFHAYLRDEKNQSDRSCWNKFMCLAAFLKAQKITGIIGKGDFPKFTEEDPETYEAEELTAFFAACEPHERLWFEFFLLTGMREQEVIFCFWSDINFARCTIRVSAKPEFKWRPKANKGREIAVPKSLIESLKTFKAERQKAGYGDCKLLFPTSGCKPKLDFLDCCKSIAKRAELKDENFWLHKFRATFATTLLQSGIDLRTVQSYLGHTDMASTLRYLRPAHGESAHQKVNDAWGAL